MVTYGSSRDQISRGQQLLPLNCKRYLRHSLKLTRERELSTVSWRFFGRQPRNRAHMENRKRPTIMVLKGPFLLNGSYVCRPLICLTCMCFFFFFLIFLILKFETPSMYYALGLWSLICFTCTVFSEKLFSTVFVVVVFMVYFWVPIPKVFGFRVQPLLLHLRAQSISVDH